MYYTRIQNNTIYFKYFNTIYFNYEIRLMSYKYELLFFKNIPNNIVNLYIIYKKNFPFFHVQYIHFFWVYYYEIVLRMVLSHMIIRYVFSLIYLCIYLYIITILEHHIVDKTIRTVNNIYNEKNIMW